jgi:hypothetical protein
MPQTEPERGQRGSERELSIGAPLRRKHGRHGKSYPAGTAGRLRQRRGGGGRPGCCAGVAQQSPELGPCVVRER